MNSLVVAILAGVAIATTALEAWRRISRARAVAVLGHGAGLFAIAVAVFIAINPAILQDVPGGLAATVSEHRLTEAIQVKFLQGHLGALGQKLGAVATMTIFHPAACVGLALCALACLRSKRPGVRFIAVWWLIAWVCVSAWIPFFRLRYVMPMIAPTVLLGAVLVESLVIAILSRVKTGGLPAVGGAARAK
jgi:hypothetical protein